MAFDLDTTGYHIGAGLLRFVEKRGTSYDGRVCSRSRITSSQYCCIYPLAGFRNHEYKLIAIFCTAVHRRAPYAVNTFSFHTSRHHSGPTTDGDDWPGILPAYTGGLNRSQDKSQEIGFSRLRGSLTENY